MNKKYASALAATALVATSLFAVSAFADTTAQASPQQPEQGQHEGFMGGMMRGKSGGMMMGQHGILGTVASINGTTLTVTTKARPMRAPENSTSTTPVPATPAPITYTVDASKATVMKAGATSAVSNIAVGDTIMVMGTTSGTTVTATRIIDGFVPGNRPAGTAGMQNSVITGNGEPVVAGSVTAISGTTITITNKSNVTYTVDATNAKVEKGNAASAISNVAVGEMIVAQGTVNGNSVTASSVLDQGTASAASAAGTNGQPAPAAHKGFFGAIGGFFSHLFGF